MSSKDKETVKIVDFGIACKENQDESTMNGTIRYMSPEQLNGYVSYKSDIWAFGCVLLELLTAQIPFSTLKENFQICAEIVRKKTCPLDYCETKQIDP